MMPVTQTVLDKFVKELPEEYWKRQVFEVANNQIEIGGLPMISMGPEIVNNWFEIWNKICPQANYSPDGKQGKIDREYIKTQIQENAKAIEFLSGR